MEFGRQTVGDTNRQRDRAKQTDIRNRADGQTQRRRQDADGRTHLLWAIKLGLKWARALREAAVAAENAAGVVVDVVAALLRQLPVRTAQYGAALRCSAARCSLLSDLLSSLSLAALSLSLRQLRSLSQTPQRRRIGQLHVAIVVSL